MNRLFLFIVVILLVAGCNSNEESSSFSGILNQLPYSPLTDSIKREPGRDELYFRRAVLLNKNNYPEPALADFQKAWSLNKKEVYAVGISNILAQKDQKTAIAFLEKATRDLPASIFLQLNLARAYDAQNRVNEALAVTDNVLKAQPDQVNTLMLQWELLEKKGDSSHAILSLEKAHAYEPENREINYNLAYQYAESRNPKALGLTDSLIARDSLKLFADPYYFKGLYYARINDRNKAIQWLDETIKINYNYLSAYIEKGKIFLAQKKTADALKVFRLANTIDPAYADAWFWIGKCQEEMGQKEEAKLSYEKAYSLDKTFAEAKEAAESIK